MFFKNFAISAGAIGAIFVVPASILVVLSIIAYHFGYGAALAAFILAIAIATATWGTIDDLRRGDRR